MQRACLALARLAALAVAATFACGGGAQDDGGAAFIARYCDVYQPCCAAAGLPTDGRACRALFPSAGRPQYVPSAGDACLAGLQQVAADIGFCLGQTPEPAACRQVFGGASAPGSTCAIDADCPPSAAGTVRCAAVPADGAELRKCQVQLVGEEGSTPCVGTVAAGVTTTDGATGGDIAPEAYVCDRGTGLRCGAGGACVRLLAEGDACELSGDCADSAICDVTLGTCAPRKLIGAACSGQALECEADAYCEESGPLCLRQRDDGSACDSNVGCRSGNCASGWCAPAAAIEVGVLCGGSG